jgi:Na+/melibiose symporter-like transporter
MAVAGVPIAIFGFVWGAGIDLGTGAGLSTADSIRAIVLTASAVALVLCLVPIAAVDEKRYCHSRPSELRLWESVRETLRNRPFRRYLVAQLPFIVGVNLISPALIYYATVVLGRTPGYIAWIGGALFATTCVAFLPVNRYAQRAGPKRTIILCVALLTVSTAVLGLLRPDVPGGPDDLRNLVLTYASMLVAGVALAGFITMPNVLIGQVVDVDTARTGANRAAMFFGVQGLATKMLYGVSGAILAWLFSAFGKSAAEPLGVLLVGPVAAAFCAVSTLLFFRYPEHETLAATIAAEETSGGHRAQPE